MPYDRKFICHTIRFRNIIIIIENNIINVRITLTWSEPWSKVYSWF